MSGLRKDATQMASGRTASQLLLQMAIEATDQNVKEIYFVKNSSVKFYNTAYKQKFTIFSQLTSVYQICWVSTRLVGYLWQSAAPKLGPLNPRSSNQGPINPFRSYVRPRPTLWFSCSAPMSEDIRHIFVVPASLSETVRRFSSCSTDFGQQTTQVVLFLFLGRPCVLMWTGDCALYSRGCACRKMAGI
jgi:hypothetical protein